jgi:hypothetical protein
MILDNMGVVRRPGPERLTTFLHETAVPRIKLERRDGRGDELIGVWAIVDLPVVQIDGHLVLLQTVDDKWLKVLEELLLLLLVAEVVPWQGVLYYFLRRVLKKVVPDVGDVFVLLRILFIYNTYNSYFFIKCPHLFDGVLGVLKFVISIVRLRV